MAKINLLAARSVSTLGEGFHSDGGNLYLRVKDSGARSWVFRYTVNGKVVQHGLGPVHTRGLAEARTLAEAMRNAIKNGIDPATALVAKHDPTAATFKDYAEQWFDVKKVEFRSAKHLTVYKNSIATHAYPRIGDKQPGAITRDDIEAVLKPLWIKQADARIKGVPGIETGKRLRQRIESILDYAAVAEGAQRPNPAAWKGNLKFRLSSPSALMDREHFAAAPHTAVPEIMASLRSLDTVTAQCLRFTILTAGRSGEVRGATWKEIDLDAKLWTIPAKRMKSHVRHRVPLCAEAVEILKALHKRHDHKPGSHVFPGQRGGLISDVGINNTRDAVYPGITTHGFRSAFRVYGELQGYRRSALEFALAHKIANEVEAAYQRDDLLELRVTVMDAWGAYCRSTVRLAASR
jgi:integrase